MLGWIGIVTLGPAWLAALVWAYTKPIGTAGLSERVTVLEDELRKLKGAQGGDAAEDTYAFRRLQSVER